MLHCTQLDRYVFFDKEYSRRWQSFLSSCKKISLYDDRSNSPLAEVVCNADYPFQVRSSHHIGGYDYEWNRHRCVCQRRHRTTLYLPVGISCHLLSNDNGKIRSVIIEYERPHKYQFQNYKKIDARGWSDVQLKQLFTGLPLAISRWKEEDDYINMEFDKIEKIRSIRKKAAQSKKKSE